MTSIDILQKLPCGHYESLWHADVQESHETLTTNGKAVAIVPAAFFVVRTNTWENFAKDLILPTVINHAIKVENAVGKVFLILGALVLDLFASPFRVVTALFIAYFNSKNGVSPLLRVLLNNQVNEKLIESGHALILLKWKLTSQDLPADHMKDYWVRKAANFIDVPTYEGWDEHAGGTFGDPLRDHFNSSQK